MIPILGLLCVSFYSRFAEYSRAIVKRNLGDEQPKVVYYGILRKDQAKIVHDIGAEVFSFWDDMPGAPPKTRPRATQAQPDVQGLVLLNHSSAGGPRWPDSLDQKFVTGSQQRRELAAIKEKFLAEFPPAVATGGPGGPATVPRAVGQPQFQPAEEPLDITRLVDPAIESPPAPDTRTLYDLWITGDFVFLNSMALEVELLRIQGAGFLEMTFQSVFQGPAFKGPPKFKTSMNF